MKTFDSSSIPADKRQRLFCSVICLVWFVLNYSVKTVLKRFVPVFFFRNIFRVAFLLSCHIFDCDGSYEDCRTVNAERRKRDLNPRAGSPDLLPFQGSPFGLLGISPKRYLPMWYMYLYNTKKCYKRRGWDSNPCAR